MIFGKKVLKTVFKKAITFNSAERYFRCEPKCFLVRNMCDAVS